MGDEDRNAIRDSDCQRDSPFGRDMSIGLISPEPSLPPAGVDQHASAMDLPDRRESTGGVGNLVLDRRPPAHDLFYRVLAREAEGAGVTGSRERANPPTLEVGDYFLRNLTHGY